MEARWASILEHEWRTWPFSLNTHYQSNTVTLQDVEEKVMTFPMFMDDEDETTQEPEESTPKFQEPLPNTSVVEESKRDECLPENKSEFEEGEPEKENERLLEIQESYRRATRNKVRDHPKE
ncbi:hypothetical protein M9H77_18239 [Catharanthus roseus]|uniref:Uncharacterized protein n=1 Tax=Catharanthus roseus TaxID=4058 RepID=A0ACC0B6W0_CATRO|nr:hypothetical protein M9H77_18239 [Catharanthus roseus]